jgi:hypothetical protein
VEIHNPFTAIGGANLIMITNRDALPSGAVFQFRQAGSEWSTWKGASSWNGTIITGLKAGTYEIRLVNKQGATLHTENGVTVKQGTTDSTPLKHKASVDKKVSKPTIASVTLLIMPHKNATNDSNARYVIDIVQAGKVKGRPADFIPLTVSASYLAQNDNKVLISGLNPNTSYKFTVTAVSANGETMDGKVKPKDVTVAVTAKTLNYTAVQKLKVDKNGSGKKILTSSAALVSWTASKAILPAGATTRYVVLMYDGNSKIPTELSAPVMAVTGTFSALIYGLSPNKSYKFAIRAITTVDGVEISSLDAKVSLKTLKAV